MTSDNGPNAPNSGISTRLQSPARDAVGDFLTAQSVVPPRSRASRILGRSPLNAASAHCFWGAVGELDVAAALERLGPGWCVLHNVPLDSAAAANADSDDANDRRDDRIGHLVVGPPGVFTVTTRNHSRQSIQVVRRAFAVDGHSVQYIRRAEVEVGYVERVLGDAAGASVTVSAIIAVIGPSSLTTRDVPRDVFVVDARVLARWFEHRARKLDPDEVEELAQIAASANTWSDQTETATPDDISDTAAERAAFDSIRRDVARARVVRSIWTVVIAVTVVGAMVMTTIATLAARA